MAAQSELGTWHTPFPRHVHTISFKFGMYRFDSIGTIARPSIFYEEAERHRSQWLITSLCQDVYLSRPHFQFVRSTYWPSKPFFMYRCSERTGRGVCCELNSGHCDLDLGLWAVWKKHLSSHISHSVRSTDTEFKLGVARSCDWGVLCTKIMSLRPGPLSFSFIKENTCVVIF